MKPGFATALLLGVSLSGITIAEPAWAGFFDSAINSVMSRSPTSSFNAFCAQMGLSASDCMARYNGVVPAAGPRFSYQDALDFLQKARGRSQGALSVCPPSNPYEKDIFSRLSSTDANGNVVSPFQLQSGVSCQSSGYYLNQFANMGADSSQSVCLPNDADFSDLLLISKGHPGLKINPNCGLTSSTDNSGKDAAGSPVDGSRTTEIQMPCVPGNTPSEIAANREAAAKRNDPMQAYRSCQEFLPEVERDVKGHLQNWVDAFYNGCSLDSEGQEVGKCKALSKPGAPVTGTSISGEVCNMLDQPAVPKTFSPGGEFETNHLGTACGNWVQMSTSLQGRNCVLSTSMGNGYHQREEAYIRGARVQAMNCKYNRVHNQFAGARKLKLTYLMTSSVNPVPGVCAALTPDWAKATSAVDQAMSQIVNGGADGKGFSQAKLIEDIENCKNDMSAKTDGIGGRRQGACYIHGMRASIEAMFKQLVACEVHYQAQLSYEQFLGSTNQSASIDQIVRELVNGSVDETLRSSAPVQGSAALMNYLTSYRKTQCTSSDSSACSVENVSNHCYQPAFRRVMQIRADDVWNQDSCN